MKIFGFELIKKTPKKELPSPVTPSHYDDDATTVASGGLDAGGYFNQVVDVEGVIKTENDLLARYRQIAQYSDCEFAIDEIVNEVIIANEDKKSLEINLDDVEVSDNIKSKIIDEFENILRLLKFEQTGQELFRQWYVDGRIYYHILVDKELEKEGIQELRKIDPRKIRKIRKLQKERNHLGVEVTTGIHEFYMYNDRGISESNVTGVKIALDSMIHGSSGLINQDNGMTLSHLHKAIKPTNQLKMIEDSLVIYRISRAPERRIFYIDVGNMPKFKAEAYVNNLMTKFRNKIVYDATTGEVRDDKRHMSILEDFWMPRRENGKGTEITTLPGGTNLGDIADIEYFQTKLFRSLNVPIGRLQNQQGGPFSLGHTTEITRDEVKFNKFILRMRKRFSDIFSQALRVQLVLKGIIREDEWDDINNKIRYDYIEDNHFSELKEQQIILSRANVLQQLDPYIGRFFSNEYIYREVLNLSEDQIKKMKKEIQKEMKEEEMSAGGPGDQDTEPPEMPSPQLPPKPSQPKQPSKPKQPGGK